MALFECLYELQTSYSNSGLEEHCTSYLFALCTSADQEVTTAEADCCSGQAIVHRANGSILAEGLVGISYWLSFRKFALAPRIQSLCGSCSASKRVVSRTLKKVLTWRNDWLVRLIPAAQQLQDPLCKAILLDKMLMHRQLRYIAEMTNGELGNLGGVTICDALLVMMVFPWLQAYEQEKDFVLRNLPCVVEYVRRVRQELRAIECVDGNSPAHAFDTYLGPYPSWVDRCAPQDSSAKPFKFTHKRSFEPLNTLGAPKAAGVSSVRADTVSAEDDNDLIDTIGQSLVGSIHWPTPPGNSGSPSLDSSLFVLPTLRPLEDSQCPLWQHMQLPPGREVRKRQQVLSLLQHALPLLPPGGVAVEFCSGGGYLGIPLAYLRPDCQVLLTDMNAVSLQFARQRAAALCLNNVRFLRAELSQLSQIIEKSATVGTGEGEAEKLLGGFDVGLALHACGAATDAVLRLCRQRGAACVVAPCCYGFLQHHVDGGRGSQGSDSGAAAESGKVSEVTEGEYPQSEAFRAKGWRSRWFCALCSRADRTYWAHDSRAATHNEQGAFAMRVIDTDRLLRMREAGYIVSAALMQPAEASVKNHILIACREEKRLKDCS